LATTEEEHIF
jgi:hypothetical protein